MFTLLEIAIFSLLALFILYLFMLSVLALFAKKSFHVEAKKRRRFACIVPAHNEELTIEKTLRAFFASDYPPRFFDVIVVADNCSDSTAEIARANGATVYERNDTLRRGKGHALQWCFERLAGAPKRYDAYVVVDADSVVSGKFLHVMNSYLERGFVSVQAADLVEPKPGAWSSEVARVALTLFNYVLPLGRKVIGCSAGLRGNGMCFSSETVRTVPWQAHSLTEDLEYGLLLLLRGIPTVFAPEATVLATMPVRPHNAESQRARWESGRAAMIRRYVPKLLNAVIRHPSLKLVDALIELLTPAFVNMMGIIIAATVVELLLPLAGIRGETVHVGLWVGLLAVCVLYILIGLAASGADALLFKATLYFPRYLFWKIRLYFKLLVNGVVKEWVRTTREGVQ
ncbi:MAG: glycosyltransferase family 2 protein [Bacteroidota bacterium]|nr:glycosyltransferase family 2 protein [Bacteroidota bacterium]